MALVGTLLLTLALGGGEYGLLMSSKHDLNVATRLAGRVGSTPCADTGSGTSTSGCNKGNTDYDDFTMLRAIESGLSGKMADVEKIVIYGTPARVGTTAFALNSGRPPGICLGAASGVDYLCNIYTEDTLIDGTSLNLFDNLDYFYLADGGFDRVKLDATFNCTAGSSSPTRPYCPTGSDPNGIPLRLRSLNGATSMGIYVKMRHNFVTGFMRDQQNLSDWTMFRLEPHPLVNETLRQCDPTVDPTCVAAPTSVQLSITDALVTESPTVGNCATVRVGVSPALDTPQNVVLTTYDDTATVGDDYTGHSQTVNFPAGATSVDVCIEITDDGFWEPTEQFYVRLSNGSSGLKDLNGNLAGDTEATVVINDDDAQPTLVVNNISINEGSTGSFTVTMVGGPLSIPASFNWSTSNGTAVAPGDYNAVPSTGVTFAPGETTKTIQVTTNTDNLTEAAENFTVNLVVLSGANPSGGDLSGTGTIVDQTPPPVVSISDPPAGVNEGTNLVFPVTLSHAATTALTVKYSTVNGTATGGLDFTAASAVTLTFPAGTTSLNVTVPTINDSIDELTPEEFTVVLSNPSAPLTIGDGTATGQIFDNDSPPTVAMSPTNTNVNEGSSKTFTITLSRASFQDVLVTFNTADGTASSASDYTGVSQTLTFTPGQTSKTITVNTTNDAVIEPNETFTVTAVGGTGSAGNTVSGTVTIIDDDTPTTTSTTTTTTRPATTTTRATTTTTRPATTTTRATTTTTRVTTSTTRPATTTTRAATTTTRAATTTTRAATTTTTTRPATTTTRATTTTTLATTTTTTRPTTTTSTTTTTRPTTTTTRPTTTTTRPATTTTIVIIDGNT